MKFKELPEWAQREELNRVKDLFLELDEEARREGRDIPYYTEKELNDLAMQYVNEHDYVLVYNKITKEHSIILTDDFRDDDEYYVKLEPEDGFCSEGE